MDLFIIIQNSKRLFWFIISFLFIFNPPLRFIPINIGLLIGYVCAFALLFRYLKQVLLAKWNILIHKRFLRLITIIISLIIYSFLIALVNVGDFQVSKVYLLFLICYFPGSYFLISKLQLSRFDQLLFFIVKLCVAQAIIIILMFVFTPFKLLIYSLLSDGITRITLNLSSGGFRFLGLSFGTTWDLSFAESIGCILYTYLFRILGAKVINIWTITGYLLCFIAVFISGRTGLIGVLMSLILLLIPAKGKRQSTILIKFTGISILTVAIGIFSFASILDDETSQLIEKNLIPWATEFFNSDGKKFETNSSNELMDMYYLPSIKTILIGDGYYRNPRDPTLYYNNVDAGYMRHLLFYGLPGVIAVVVFYICFLRDSWLMQRQFMKDRLTDAFWLILITYVLIGHVKGDLFIGADVIVRILCLLYFCTYYCFKNNERIRI